MYNDFRITLKKDNQLQFMNGWLKIIDLHTELGLQRVATIKQLIERENKANDSFLSYHKLTISLTSGLIPDKIRFYPNSAEPITTTAMMAAGYRFRSEVIRVARGYLFGPQPLVYPPNWLIAPHIDIADKINFIEQQDGHDFVTCSSEYKITLVSRIPVADYGSPFEGYISKMGLD